MRIGEKYYTKFALTKFRNFSSSLGQPLTNNNGMNSNVCSIRESRENNKRCFLGNDLEHRNAVKRGYVRIMSFGDVHHETV